MLVSARSWTFSFAYADLLHLLWFYARSMGFREHPNSHTPMLSEAFSDPRRAELKMSIPALARDSWKGGSHQSGSFHPEADEVGDGLRGEQADRATWLSHTQGGFALNFQAVLVQ